MAKSEQGIFAPLAGIETVEQGKPDPTSECEHPMTETPSPDQAALLALAELRERLRSIENDRETRLAGGMSDPDASLAAAILAVQAVLRFCEVHSIERRSISRLCLDLAAIAGGRRQSAMLRSRRARARPADHPMIEELKGHLVAIMEYLQTKGFSRKKASVWISDNLPTTIKQALKSPAPKTISGWHVDWGGDHAEVGRGRSGYLAMKEALCSKDPPVTDLPAWIKALDRYLPPMEESG